LLLVFSVKIKIELHKELNLAAQQAWYAEFLFEIALKILLRKIGAR
jgi:hypothetical protein